jgi:murein DD-endopeptidase MepM/ murein hydrolase activator NlpD
MSRSVVDGSPSSDRPQASARGHFLCLKIACAASATALIITGCSADISRFDGQGYGLTDSGSAKIPAQGMRRGEPARLGDAGGDSGPSTGGAYYPPSSGNGGSNTVRMSALPEPVGPAPQQQRSPSIAPRPLTTSAAPVKPRPIQAGATIDVAPGDTLYAIARRHAVPVNELMTVNNLTAPTIKPGQKLVLPASRSIARVAVPLKPIQRAEPVRMAAIPQPSPVASSPAMPAPVAMAPIQSDWQGSYTVKTGESLYGIARAHRVSFAQLQQVNGIADATKVKPGSVLKVPAGVTQASLGAAPNAPVAPVVTATPPATAAKVAGAVAATETSRVVQVPTKPVILNPQVAAVSPTAPATDPTPVVEATVEPKQKGTEVAAAGGAMVTGQKFRWPVKGRVIANYGPRSDSTHNDGINIAVPIGTEVLAAEQGVVAYAGSELKGYGNLILLRHDNGWVTAYAHNEEILVKRGDKVKRGQGIAKAGKTGTVDQPQVHFELRQGQKPVDPMPHMEKL